MNTYQKVLPPAFTRKLKFIEGVPLFPQVWECCVGRILSSCIERKAAAQIIAEACWNHPADPASAVTKALFLLDAERRDDVVIVAGPEGQSRAWHDYKDHPRIYIAPIKVSEDHAAPDEIDPYADLELPDGVHGQIGWIFRLAKAGKSVGQIAKITGLCRRQINNILKDKEKILAAVAAAAAQPDFFGFDGEDA